jgi:AcrR family transcriptional regulator
MTTPKRRYTMTARAEKAQATRDRILSSAMSIYTERPIEDFTLEDIARRAETTVQTVLRAYGSKENLVLEALDALAAQGQPAKASARGNVAAAVRTIFDIYETAGDFVISRLADERRHPQIKPSLDRGRAAHFDWVAQAFGAQLHDRPDLFEMLGVLTDVYVWKLLRRDRGLDRAAAESLVTTMITSVLKGSSDGKSSLAQLVGRRKSPA